MCIRDRRYSLRARNNEFGDMETFAGAVKEAHAGDHTPVVQIHQRYGMILFIASEVMFFVAWFWAFFDFSLFPDPLPAREVEDIAKLGDELTAMVVDVENGKVRMSRQAVLEGWSVEEAQSRDRGNRGGGSSGGRPGGDRGGRDSRGGDRRGGDRGGRDSRGPRR